MPHYHASHGMANLDHKTRTIINRRLDLGMLQRFLVFFRDPVGGVTVINLLLAVTAAGKDLLLASYLGTSTQADAFWLAFFIPDLLGNNLLAMALGVAVVPLLARLLSSREDYRLPRAVVALTTSNLIVAVALALLGWGSRDWLIALLGSGLDSETQALAARLLVLMLPAIVFLALGGIGTAVLQAHYNFIIPALAPVLSNLVLFSASLYAYWAALPGIQGVYLLALAFSGGSLAMAAIVGWGIGRGTLRNLFRLKPGQFDGYYQELKRAWVQLVPYLLILIVIQGGYAVERYLAAGLGAGRIAGLNYAFRVAQFPTWVFVAAISTVVLPTLSRTAFSGHRQELGEIVESYLLLVLLITLPMGLYLFSLRLPVITILFQRGAFDAFSVHLTAGVLKGYALAVVPLALSLVSQRVLLALGRPALALMAWGTAFVTNVALDWYLVGRIGVAGLGYGAAGAAVVNATFNYYLLRQLTELRGQWHWERWGRIVAANLLLLPLVGLLLWFWRLAGADPGAGIKLVFIALVLVSSLAVYGLGLRWLQVPLGAILHTITGRRESHADS